MHNNKHNVTKKNNYYNNYKSSYNLYTLFIFLCISTFIITSRKFHLFFIMFLHNFPQRTFPIKISKIFLRLSFKSPQLCTPIRHHLRHHLHFT
eukprot:UN06506